MKNYRFHKGVVQLPGGQRQLVIGTAPRQYLDSRGRWKDIETDLSETAKSFNLSKSAFLAQIPKKANGTILFGNVGTEFRMKPVCQAVDGILSSPNVVTYSNAFGPGINIQIKVGSKGIKKWVVIKKTSQKKLTFDFEICCSGLPDLKAFAAKETGAIVGVDGIAEKNVFPDQKLIVNDDVVTAVSHVNAWDGDGRHCTIPVDSSILKENGKTILRKMIGIPDNAVFPITTDASISVGSGAWDATLGQTSATWAGGRDAVQGIVTAGASSINAAVDSFMGFMFSAYRAAMTFDTSGIGSSLAVISSASLWISRKYIGAPGQVIRLVPFETVNESGYATTDYNISHWGTTQLATGDLTVNDVGFSPQTITLVAAGFNKINKVGNTMLGFREVNWDIDDVQPSNYRGVGIESSESGSSTDPQLTVNYYIPKTIPLVNGSLIS